MKDHWQERARVEAVRRRLDTLLNDLNAGIASACAPGPEAETEPEPGVVRPPAICAHQALRCLGTRWAAHVELLRETLEIYRLVVTRAIREYGETRVRGWLAHASPGCASATHPGGCPTPGSPLQGLPCTCYAPGWCEQRFIGPTADAPRVPELRSEPPLESITARFVTSHKAA